MPRVGARLAAALALLTLAAAPASPIPPSRPVVAHHWIGRDLLTLRSEPWFAGAVNSIRFRGAEFVDSADHGRLLQGAIAFDGRLECLNPTQAGASSDGRRRTTSRRLWAEVSPGRYVSSTRMAYWLRPGQVCRSASGEPERAANTRRLSDVVYTQRFSFGHGAPNVVLDEITFTTGTTRRSAVVEALTIYTPPAFGRFHRFDPATGALDEDREVPEQPGEQPLPVILATADGRSAVALLGLTPGAAYGRWIFEGSRKINVVYRPPGPYEAGEHHYRCAWIVGSLEEVRSALVRLHANEGRQPAPEPSVAR